LRRLTVITDVPTPYRIYTFNLLSDKLKIENIDFEVYFLGETAAHRYWEIDKSTLKFKFYFEKGIKIVFTRRSFYFNPEIILKLINSDIDNIILGGGWSQPSIILILILSKFKKWKTYFWLELNENAVHFNNFFMNFIRLKIINLSNNFILPGESALKFLKKINYRPFNYIFFPNLINERFYIREDKISIDQFYESSDQIEKKIVFWPCRLNEHDKGVINFLGIIKDHLILNKDQIKIVIAGEGPDREIISSFIKKNRLENIVELKGFLNQDQIKNYYLTSHLFLLPSLIDPNPLSVVEALWSSLPIMVSSNCGNSLESVIEEHNGWILNLSNPKSIVDSWTKFVKSDYSKLREMGKESFKIANTYFDSNKEIDNLIKSIKYNTL
jgi:hypothetical protein